MLALFNAEWREPLWSAPRRRHQARAFADSLLEPDPHANNQAGCSHTFASLPRNSRGPANFPFPGYTHVWCYLAFCLIAEPQPYLRICDARTQALSGDILGRDIELRPGLKDESLGEPHIVIPLDAAQNIPLVGDKKRSFNIEPVRCQTLNSYARISAR